MFLIGGRAHFELSRIMRWMVSSTVNPESDRGDDIRAEVELSAGRSHKAKEDKERKDIRDHGNEPDPGREKHGCHEDKDNALQSAPGFDLSADNIASRAREEDQVARGMDAEFRREMSSGQTTRI